MDLLGCFKLISENVRILPDNAALLTHKINYICFIFKFYTVLNTTNLGTTFFFKNRFSEPTFFLSDVNKKGSAKLGLLKNPESRKRSFSRID